MAPLRSTSTRLARRLTEHGGTITLVLVLGLSLGLNVYYASRVRAPVSERGFVNPIGSAVPPVRVTALDGLDRSLTFEAAQPTVIYQLSPRCAFCDRNYQNINALFAHAGLRYRFVGIVSSTVPLRELRQHLDERPLPFEVFSVSDDQWLDSLGFRATPITAVVGADGRITQFWRGAYGDKLAQNIKTFFGVNLPGLTRAKS